MTSDEEIQILRGRCARLEIQLEIIKDIIKDKIDIENLSPITQEYWCDIHDDVLRIKSAENLLNHTMSLDKKKKPSIIDSIPTSPPPPRKRGVSFKDFKDLFS